MDVEYFQVSGHAPNDSALPRRRAPDAEDLHQEVSGGHELLLIEMLGNNLGDGEEEVECLTSTLS